MRNTRAHRAVRERGVRSRNTGASAALYCLISTIWPEHRHARMVPIDQAKYATAWTAQGHVDPAERNAHGGHHMAGAGCRDCSGNIAGDATVRRNARNVAAHLAIHAAAEHSSGIDGDCNARPVSRQPLGGHGDLCRARQCRIARSPVRRRRAFRRRIAFLCRQRNTSVCPALIIVGRTRRASLGRH
jgi:hypothetical protein